MMAVSAFCTDSEVRTRSSNAANATAAIVPTAYSAVFMPSSRRNSRIAVEKRDRRPRGLSSRGVATRDRPLQWVSVDIWRSLLSLWGQRAAEHGDDHRHETGEHKGRQEAKAERQHDEHSSPASRCLRRSEPVVAEVFGDAVQRAGERRTAVLAADSGADESRRAVDVTEVGPGLVRRRSEPQRPVDSIQASPEWTAERPANAPRSEVWRRPGLQHGGQQVAR